MGHVARLMRMLRVALDGPATVRLRESLAQACPVCGHGLSQLHTEERFCRACLDYCPTPRKP